MKNLIVIALLLILLLVHEASNANTDVEYMPAKIIAYKQIKDDAGNHLYYKILACRNSGMCWTFRWKYLKEIDIHLPVWIPYIKA